jgi:hypothetical protein
MYGDTGYRGEEEEQRYIYYYPFLTRGTPYLRRIHVYYADLIL